VADHGHREGQRRRPGDVPAGDRGPGLGGQGDHPVEQPQALPLAEVGRDPEHDVGLAGLGPHRRQVGERGGQRLAPDRRQVGVLAAEVHPLDHGVDRGRGGAAGDGDRGVVAGAEPDAGPGGGEALAHLGQQLELTHRLMFAPRT